MVLTEGLTDADGHTGRWEVLPGFARMSGKLAALAIGTPRRCGQICWRSLVNHFAHEFRYSSWVRDTTVADETAAWEVKGTRGEVPNDGVGYARGNFAGS